MSASEVDALIVGPFTPFDFVTAIALALGTIGATGWAMAQGIPHSLVASPGIYKLIAENEQYRVIEVTWKPGQRDQFHAHPASAVYYLTDCNLRGYGPNGVLGQRENKAGTAIVQAPIPSHSTSRSSAPGAERLCATCCSAAPRSASPRTRRARSRRFTPDGFEIPLAVAER